MGVYRVTEISSSSPQSWEDATAKVVEDANLRFNRITSVYVQDQTARVVNGKVNEFCVTAKVTYEIVNHKSTVTNMKTKSKSHAAPKAVKKAAAKKAAPKKKAAAKKAAPKKKAAAKKAAPKKAAAKKAAPKKAAAKKAAPKKAAAKKAAAPKKAAAKK
jgi:flavin-binding protein dodecin